MMEENKVLVKPAEGQEIVNYLCRTMSISRWLGNFLVNRGIFTPREAGFFLFGDLCDLPSPFELQDMDIAVERIKEALKKQEKIMVYGDYDADGITSTALLTLVLRELGGDVFPFLPRREKEGYGLDGDAVKKAAEEGIKLLITVDCGSKNPEEITLGRSLGLDVIITDHHQIEDLPPANAVINPHRFDNLYPFPDLAGVGIAFKVCQALLEGEGALGGEFPLILKRLLPLVAIGTVADLVPLREENRILVKNGLKELEQTSLVGLKALLKETGAGNEVNSGNIAFGIAPRLNAAGRLKTANIALELLLSRDESKAKRLAIVLGRLNRRRQKVEEKIVEEARALFTTRKDDRILVGASDKWNPGVVGIAASKLVEEFSRPVLLIGLEGSEGKGSGRSLPGFNLYNALKSVENLLIKFGGHPMAAGLSVSAEKVEELNQRLNEYARENLPEKLLRKRIAIEGLMDIEQTNLDLINDIEKLAPFGIGNPRPLFSNSGLTVQGKRQVGRDGKHLQISLVSPNKKIKRQAIAFKMGHLFTEIKTGSGYQTVFAPKINNWNGKREIQLEIKDISPAYSQEERIMEKKEQVSFSLIQSGNLQEGREKIFELMAEEIRGKGRNGVYIAPSIYRLARAWEKRPETINCEFISGFTPEKNIYETIRNLEKEKPKILFLTLPVFFYFFKTLSLIPLIFSWESPYPDFSPEVFYGFLQKNVKKWDQLFALEFKSRIRELPFTPNQELSLGERELGFQKVSKEEITEISEIPVCIFSRRNPKSTLDILGEREIIKPNQAIEREIKTIAILDFPPTGGEFISFLENWKGEKIFYYEKGEPWQPHSRKIDREKLAKVYRELIAREKPFNCNDFKHHPPEIVREALVVFGQLGLVKLNIKTGEISWDLTKTRGRNVDLFRSLRYNEFVNEKEAYLRWKEILQGRFSQFINNLGGA